jgi:hypothetical protein
MIRSDKLGRAGVHGWTHSSLPKIIDDVPTFISEILLFAGTNSIDPED